MQAIPIKPKPAQTFAITLGNQPCRIYIWTTTNGMFCDLYINDLIVIGGAPCLHGTLVANDAYHGFIGDLVFWDLRGTSDPVYTELGSRYILLYLEASDFASLAA